MSIHTGTAPAVWRTGIRANELLAHADSLANTTVSRVDCMLAPDRDVVSCTLHFDRDYAGIGFYRSSLIEEAERMTHLVSVVNDVIVSSSGISSSSTRSTLPLTISAELERKLAEIYRLDVQAASVARLNRKVLRRVIDLIEDQIDESDFISLNALLRRVDPQKLRKASLVSFLRTSFRVRRHLPAWTRLYSQTWITLDARGDDAAHALRGLTSPGR